MVYIIDSNFNKCFVYLIVQNQGIVHLNDSKCMLYSNCDKSLRFAFNMHLLGFARIQVYSAFIGIDHHPSTPCFY